MPQDRNSRSDAVNDVVGAADRAGAIVTDQVRSIVGAAEDRAAELRRQANADAAKTRQAASEVATSVLERIDAMGGPLNSLVTELRTEADRVQANIERSSSE